MTRVLVTASTFPVRQDDGIPRFILDLAQALSRHVEVCVLAPDAPGAALHEQMGNVSVERFSYFWPRSSQKLAITNNRGMRDNLRGSLLAKLQVPLFMLRQATKVRQLVRTRSIQVVNAHWMVPQGLTAAWALRAMPEVNLVLHVHAGDVYLLQKLSCGQRIARYVVKRSSMVLADGSHVRDALNKLLGYDAKAVLQPMGVNYQQFACGQNGQFHQAEGEDSSDAAGWDASKFADGFILFFGRLAEKKGTIYLVRAFARILQSKPGVGLVIVGYGPEESRLRAEVRQLGLEDQVVFLGRQPHATIVRILHVCRAAAVPSIIDSRGETEGMPTVVVEALAAGVPVVASNVDGIPDVIRHTENGWLCREKDPDDLAEKLLAALECDRHKYRLAAEETAAKHDWQQVAANYLTFLQR